MVMNNDWSLVYLKCIELNTSMCINISAVQEVDFKHFDEESHIYTSALSCAEPKLNSC